MSEVVAFDPETGEVTERAAPVVMLSAAEAEALTAQIISYGQVINRLLRQASEQQAWKALGYSSFAAWFNDRFGHGKARAYQLLAYAVLTERLAVAAELDESTIVDWLPEGRTRGLDPDELIAMVEEAMANAPHDATSRSKLLDALIADLRRQTGSGPKQQQPGTTKTTTTTVTSSPEAAPAAEGESVGGDGSTPATSDAPIPPVEPAATDEDAGDAEDHPVEGEQAADPDPAAGSGSPHDPPTVDEPGAVTAPAASGSSHLLALAYAALDGQWESPNLGIDAESFWLPLIALLEEQAA